MKLSDNIYYSGTVMLSPTKINEIESTAKELLSSVYSSTENINPPIDLEPILKQYGLTVKFVKFRDSTISGAYDKEEKTIYIAGDEIYTRKAFTIAHELGHFILHKDKDREFFYRMDIARISEEEREDEQMANWFASALLMPENLIRKYWDMTKDIDKLSIIFGTSPTSVYFRLKNLHLID